MLPIHILMDGFEFKSVRLLLGSSQNNLSVRKHFWCFSKPSFHASTYVPFEKGIYIPQVHICRSDTVKMYRENLFLFLK
jgi:hypothetical protein